MKQKFYSDDECKALLQWVDSLTVEELAILKDLWDAMKEKH